MKPGAEVARLSPSPTGWRLWHAGVAREFAGLGEAAATLPERVALHLALPCQAVLLERLTLPSTLREELAGMAQLQLEKTLPYPVEEVTSGLEVIQAAGEESIVLSMAVHTPALTVLAAPLREAGHTPWRITLFAQGVAGEAPPGERVLMVWPEQGQTVLAIVEDQHLSWAQTLPGMDAEAAAELPAFLLGAEMNGLPVDFTRALLAAESAALGPALRGALECPVDQFSTAALEGEGAADFLPPAWSAEAHREERAENLRQRLLLAAVLYLVLVAAGFLYLAWNKRQLQVVEGQLARLQPVVEATRAREARWDQLAPAVDWHHYTIETLSLVNKNRPRDDVRITVFDSSPGNFMVEGEAPSPELAIDFAERLRQDPELAEYQIETAPPQILPNEHAHFVIYGKPKGTS